MSFKTKAQHTEGLNIYVINQRLTKMLNEKKEEELKNYMGF